jgi:YD repeat-containing protein
VLPSSQFCHLANIYFYDARKRLVETDYPDGKKKTNTYDGPGNLSSVTDQAGNQVQYTYDAANQLKSVIGALTSTAIDVNMLPQRVDMEFDDMMTSSGVPVNFHVVATFTITDPVKLVSEYGADTDEKGNWGFWQRTVDQPLRTAVRDAVKKGICRKWRSLKPRQMPLEEKYQQPPFRLSSKPGCLFSFQQSTLDA